MEPLNLQMEGVWKTVLWVSMRIQLDIVIGVIHLACHVQDQLNSNVSLAKKGIIFTDHNVINTHVLVQLIQLIMTVVYVSCVNGVVKFVQVHTIVQFVQVDFICMRDGVISNVH